SIIEQSIAYRTLSRYYCRYRALSRISRNLMVGAVHTTRETTMKYTIAAVLAGAQLFAMPLADAQDTIKVGVIAAFSGPFADYGKQMEGGIKAYMAQHGDTVAGKRIQLILKDTTGPSPEIAKR